MKSPPSLQLARLNLRRTWRSLVGTRRRQVLVGIILFVFGVFLLGSLRTMYRLGKLGTEANHTSVPTIARQHLASIFTLVVVLVAIRTVEHLSHVDAKEFLFTTVSTRTVVSGVLLAEFTRLALSLCLLASAFAAAFALGSGSYLAIVTVPAVALPLLVVALLSGYLVGLLVRIVAVHLRRGSLLKYVFVSICVIILGVVGQPILVTSGVLHSPIIEIHTIPFDPTLFDSYAVLFFLGTPFSTTITLDSIAAAVVFFAVIPISFEGIVRLSAVLWYGDSGRSKPPTGTPTSQRTQISRAGVSNTSVWLALWLWRRNLRRPRYFVRLAYLAFMFGLPILRIFSNPDDLYRYGPVLVSIVAALLSGELFAIMSPRSEDRILPVVQTTPGGGRKFAHARILAGLVFGVPLIAGGVLSIGLLGGWGAGCIIGAVIIGGVLAGASTALALALGAFFASDQGSSGVLDESITANPIAVGVHTVGVTILGILSFSFLLVPEFYQSVLGGLQWSRTTITIGGIGVSLVLLVGLTGSCYRFALREYTSITS